MTKWRGKIRYGICVVVLLLFVFVAGTYFGNRMTRNDVITQHKVWIGSLYEENPNLCEDVLFIMFQEADQQYMKKADKALLQFGYTKEGMDYLYEQSDLKQIGERILIFQIVIAGAILVCVELFMRNQQGQIEEQMDKDIKIVKKQSKKESLIAKGMAQNFVENVAHQIKTPLACVSLSLDMLQEELKEETQKEKIQETFVYLKQIEVLMKRLMDIGRLESGKQMLKKEEISLEELLQSCVKSFDAKAERIVLEVKKDVDPVSIFYGDYDWLREAFCNILKNAYEHDTSQSRIFVTMHEQKELIFIQIEDSGEGIPKEDMKHIFDRFYIPERAKKGHTGIGLNLAKLVIEKHFGTIEAKNREEGGTQISICFPLYGFKNQKI